MFGIDLLPLLRLACLNRSGSFSVFQLSNSESTEPQPDLNSAYGYSTTNMIVLYINTRLMKRNQYSTNGFGDPERRRRCQPTDDGGLPSAAEGFRRGESSLDVAEDQQGDQRHDDRRL